MLDGVEGGFTKYMPSGEQMPVYDAAMKYIDEVRSVCWIMFVTFKAYMNFAISSSHSSRLRLAIWRTSDGEPTTSPILANDENANRNKPET